MRFVRFALLAVAVAGLAAAADPTLFNMAPADAKMLAGVHVSQTAGSTFGQFVLSQMQNDTGLQKLTAETGFDPRRDLADVVIASNAEGKPGSNGLVIAKGTFDLTRILGYLKTQGATVTAYNGASLVTNMEGKSDGALAFLDSATVVAGNPDQVRAAVDRRKVGSAIDPKLLSRAADLSSRNDIWFVTNSPATQTAALPPAPGGSPIKGDMLKAVQQASGGVKFNSSTVAVSGEAVMRSDKDATALADVFRFFASMAQLNSSDPKMAKLATMLNGMQLETNSNVMKMSLTLNETDLEQLVPVHANQAPRRTASARRAR